MNNVEFSSVKITKALHDAVKGASDILGKSEQDFIHSVLAFEVGRIIRENSETIHLYGESIEDDVESLRRYFSLKEEGKRVGLMTGGTRRHLENISKAMELAWKEVESDVSNEDDDFKLFFRNVDYERKCNSLKDQLLSGSLDEDIDYEKMEFVVKGKQEKYRAEKGYLESEIPFWFVPRLYQSIVDPHAFLTQADLALSLAQEIDTGNFTIREIVLFIFTFRQLAEGSKKKLEGFLGKKRMDRIEKLIESRIKNYIISRIDESLDILERKNEESGQEEKKLEEPEEPEESED